MSMSSPQQSVRKRLLLLLNRLDGGPPVEGAWEQPARAAFLARLTDAVVESAAGLGVHMPHELFVASNGSTPRFGPLGRRGRAGGPSRPPLALLGFLALGPSGGLTLEDGVVTLDVAPCMLPPECVGALVLIPRAALVRRPAPPSPPRPLTPREAAVVEAGEALPVLTGQGYEAWRAAQGPRSAAPRAPAPPTTFIARLVAVGGGLAEGGTVLVLEDEWEVGAGSGGSSTFPLLLRGALWPRIVSCLGRGERYVFTGVESDEGLLALHGQPCTVRWWEGVGGGGGPPPIRTAPAPGGEGPLPEGQTRVRDVRLAGQTGSVHRLPRGLIDVIGRVAVVGADYVVLEGVALEGVEGFGRVVVLARGAAGALPLAARVGSTLAWYRLAWVGEGWEGALRPTPVSWARVLAVAEGGAGDPPGPPPPPHPSSVPLPRAGEGGEAAPALLHRVRTLLALSTVGAAFFPPSDGPACEPWLPPLLAALSSLRPGEEEGAAPCPLAFLREGVPLVPPSLTPVPPASIPLLTPSALASASLAAAHAALTVLSARVNGGTPAPWHRVMENDSGARRGAQGRWNAEVGRAAGGAAAGALGCWTGEGDGGGGVVVARVAEGWTRLILPLPRLAPLLALRYGCDSATGLVTGGDGGVRLPLSGSVPLPPPPRPAPPPVEVLPTAGWSLHIDLVPAPVLLAVPPPPPAGWPGGEEPPCAEGLATLEAASRIPPAPRPLLAAPLFAALPALLAPSALDAAVAVGRGGPGGWDGPAADARAVWGGAGWAGGWTDLWLTPAWRRELPPTAEGPPPKKQGAGMVAAIQWRARLCLHWGGAGLPRALARLGREARSTPCRPGPASNPGASPFWFCPSLPPRIRAARFPHEVGAQTAPGSAPVLLVDSSGVLAPGRPTPLPPPAPVLAELANVITDGRIASKAGDVGKGLGDAGAVRDARAQAAGPTHCAPSLPPGLGTHLALGRPLRLLFPPSALSPTSRLALDGPTLALQPWVGEGAVEGLPDAGACAPSYAEGVAAGAGRATTWPTLPRLLLTVRGALGGLGEVCTGHGGDESERPRSCEWEAAVVGGEGGKEAPRPAYDRRTSGGLPPTLALLGRIAAIRLVAEGDEGAPAEGEGGGADGELFGRWAATGPAGRASTQALLTLTHVGAGGEEGDGEDAIALYMTLGDARVGGVLPHGFGPGAVVLVSGAMREHGSGSRPFLRSSGGVCTLLQGAGRVRQAAALFTVLDAPPPPVGPTLAALAASPVLSRCTLSLPARPQQLISLTLVWECPASGVQCAPVPPATLARAGGLARLAASLPPTTRLYAVPCAPDRTMVRMDALQRLVAAVAGAPPGRPPPAGRRPPPPYTFEPVLRLSAEARITDGSGSARLFGSDLYEASGVGRVDVPPSSELGPMTRLLGLGRRALGHFAAAAAALGPLTCARLFTADTSGVGRGPGWASEEAAGAGGAMFGTWLPPGGGEADFDPLEENSEDRERAYWALLGRARRRAAGAAEEWRESGGEAGSRKRPRSSGRHPHVPDVVRAVAAALPRDSALGAGEKAAVAWQAAGLASDRTALLPTLAHLRVPYHHAAAAAGALRLCVLSQLEGRSSPAPAAALTLSLRPHFRSDYTLPTAGPGRAILAPPPFLSRELRWRRDAAMRTAAPLLAARTRLSLFAARDRAALAALDAWQGDVEDAADAQAASPLQAANTRASFRPALRLAVQAGAVGLAALPGAAGRRPPGLRVLLPATPAAHRLLPGGESRNMGEEAAGPRPPLSAMPLPQLLYRLVGAV